MFSVIIPTYNRAHLLPRCIKSVLDQTFGDFEIVVADDGSTDNSREVVRQLAENDSRIRYTWQENQGAGDARNLGASVARGDYFTFLDSDDEVEPEWLASFQGVIQSEDAVVVCCGCSFIDENGLVSHERLPRDGELVPAYRRGYFFTGTFAVRKDAFELVGGYAPGLPANQHSELRMRLLPMCQERHWRIGCIQRPLVKRHSHAGPNIRSNARAVYDSGVYILNEHGRQLRENRKSYADWSAAVAGSAVRLNLYPEARKWFWRAITCYPLDVRNYARLGFVLAPGLRRILSRRKC